MFKIFAGSRIRGTVAQISFDEFHRHSSMIIQAAVFGVDKNNVPLTELTFHENQLVRNDIRLNVLILFGDCLFASVYHSEKLHLLS